ncbi:LuxR C-terminal-related transcriptional regulator [Lentzea sp. NPDC051838]|uniref:LuxR C-terminal-related transcriptional regulator n=1 Tax=Lentzea sp. NPDC051838 TaxID=3154849 RepID=UPI0034140FFA
MAKRAHLSADDLAALSDAAWWVGRIQESLATCESAYRAYQRAGEPRRAAKTAMDLAFLLFLRAEDVLAAAWLGRAKRLLDGDTDCVEHAYLRYFLEVECGSDAEVMLAAAREIRPLGVRFADPALVAVTTASEGRVLIGRGRVAEGLALLDEAMAAVVAGELPEEWAGNIYCNVIAICHELVDLRRMRTWTDGLELWCSRQAAAVLFTGICRVHRAQLLQIRGEWARSEALAAQAGADVRELSVSSAAEAHYVVGEARRLRGDLAGAERAFVQAHELGRDPQPGMALLRLAEGRTDIALHAVRVALAAVDDPLPRAPLCFAAVEVALAARAGDIARDAADELLATADRYGSAGLRALAGHAHGAVLLSEVRPAEALAVLRRACADWLALDAPYDAAQVRLLLARAYAAVGDLDASERERAAATSALRRLDPAGSRALPDGLTVREVEVLALVAKGRTNRQVAAALVLSEKTVARHLSNIYTKLGLSSRTAAATYAHQHGLTDG